ncbi:hypothetical protein BP5796_04337 [Coleophoma crateriformis]|uniref:Heterokaryon incompatibility domain-containing protein n=1 Tax=Coleophoma crateriformis TaxID=565419 RepID=A0A3D8SIA9_9HELO|nr:hypothetical protein BP5796_04337 [Coleophoma crateriformis]
METVYGAVKLNTHRKELRLITIDRTTTTDKLRCSLGTFSLLDTTPEYNRFLSERYPFPGNATAVLKAWHGSEPIDTFPDVAYHRYQWGDYTALSYVWGDPNDTTGILINGVEMQITKNLAAALYSLYQTDKLGDRFRLWADALCIDQTNNEERSEQIAVMRSFYVEAWSVIGFLGLQADASESAIDLLNTLAEIYDSQEKCEELRDNMIHHNFQHTPGSWLALNRLLLRPYWQRLWIMQELALGGARMVLICGSRRITWPTFCRGIGVIHFYLWIARHEAIKQDRWMERGLNNTKEWDATRLLHHIWKDLWMLSQCQELQSNAPKLSRLLEMTNSCSCYDNRDKVYGVLGIMDSKLSSAIQPDYASSGATVFTKTAKAYIPAYNDLEILRSANIWGKAGAPSWVPDWTWSGRRRDSRPDDDFQPENPEDNAFLAERRPYHADKGLRFVMPEFHCSYLGCRAVIFDAVDGLGRNPEENTELVQSLGTKSAYGNFKTTSRQLGIALYGSRWGHNEEHTSVLLSLPVTMEEARRRFSELGWKSFIEDVSLHYHRWVDWYQINASLLVGGKELRKYFTGQVEDDSDMVDCWSAYCAWARMGILF